MYDIDEKIKETDEAICENIDLISVKSRGFVAQNILSHTRNLIEYVAIKAYSTKFELPKSEYELNKAAGEYIKSENRFLFLRKFHGFVQESLSHYTPSKDGAERLALKYYEYYVLLKEFVKKEFGIDILHNLDLFPLNMDNSVKGYYIEVLKSLKKNWPINDFNTGRLYVINSKPVYIEGEVLFENTLIPASDYSSKFDRFIVFSSFMIPDHYAIKCCIFPDEISVETQKMPINIMTYFEVSIRPCELSNFGRLFNYTFKIEASHSEYKGLMKYLTITGATINDIMRSSEKNYVYIKNQICMKAKTVNFCNVMDAGRKLIVEGKSGANIISYLSTIMRNKVLKDQYYNAPNGQLSDLLLSYKCIPFEQMPFATSLLGHNIELSKVYGAFSDEGRQHELFARAIKNNSDINGTIYAQEDDLLGFDNRPQLVDKYNNNLYYKHRPKREIKKFGNYYYIDEYFNDTKTIIERLMGLSKDGLVGHYNTVASWIDSNPSIIDCDEKRKILEEMFAETKVSLIYGAAGTGKTFLLNHISQIYDSSKKLYLANTNPAVDNLKRKVSAQNCNFSTIAKYIKSGSVDRVYDIVIVDECSMVSNSDMRQILEKTSFNLLILVGDIYQIESITFGNWFGLARYFLKKKSWHELTTPYRAKNDELKALWTKVRNLDDDITEYLDMKGYCSCLNDSIFKKNDKDEIILCLNYNGLYGINNINRFLQNNNKNKAVSWGIWTYKIDDPVLFNECERFYPALYNNLKGKIVDIEQDNVNSVIWFDIEVEKVLNEMDVKGLDLEIISGDSEKTLIRFSVMLPDEDADNEDISAVMPFQIAYAVSIHKAQGLEYDSVKVVITEDIDELITHNIFYTAITRAKKHLKIYWTPESEKQVLGQFNISNIRNEANIFSGQSHIKICNKCPEKYDEAK